MKKAPKPLILHDFKAFFASGRQDSNLRHLAPKGNENHAIVSFFNGLHSNYTVGFTF